MKQKIFLSDNDGTLTSSRKPLSNKMVETLLTFTKYFRFAVVTGSPFKDMLEQMPRELLYNDNIDFWVCMGNVLYQQGEEKHNSNNTIDFNFFEPDLNHIIKNCPHQFHKCHPRHHEINNNCSINFTMLGRPTVGEPCNEDRSEYVKWDKATGQRAWIIDYLSEKYPDYNFTLGGQISVDIVKKGCDKAQVVNYYKDFDISYFGDRIYKTGNDNAVAHEVVDMGGTIYSVNNPEDTIRIMQNIIRNHEEGTF